MAKPKVERILSGTDGTAWINGDELGELKSIELKVTAKYDDVDFCGDYATHYRYMGWSGEGNIKFNKTYSRGMNLLAEAFKNGVMPDIKIITKLTDKSTGKSERASVDEVSFTELMLAKFESKKLTEEELPLKFANYTPLETIDN